MTIFGKSLSEYVGFQKVILGLILIVAVGRLVLSLAGVPVSVDRWLSVTAAMAIGLLYVAIRIPTSGFGSYKHLLPLLVIQGALAQIVVFIGIALAIFSGTDNIYTLPEYFGGRDGKNWGHAGAHLLLGIIVAPLVFWLVGSAILFLTKKAVSKDASARTAA